MARTVDDLSRAGRLRVGRAAPVDLGAEAAALVAEQAGPAGARGLRVAAAPGPRVVVDADQGTVHAAVGNLLANAVRLAPTGSTVTVRWGTRRDWAWIGVQDEGPGIAPVDQPRVFERHWRGRHERDRRDEPLRGLGLTIARQLVEAQGGALTLVSREGAGSSFVVWLPRTDDARRDDVVAADGIHPAVDPTVQPVA
jgi:signal transduction histidine kinase